MSPSVADKAETLRTLHSDSEILVLTNVWDVASAKAITAVEGTKAVATASHSIAAAFGYEDGENISLDLHLSMVERIAAATDLPVSMDFEAGYGDAGETTRRAIAAGVVGANLEDQMKPIDEAVAAVEAVVAAREAEGTGFILNARTDAFVRAHEDTPAATVLSEAIQRGLAFLEAGAEVVFVPRVTRTSDIEALVDEFGPQKLSVIETPAAPPTAELEKMGVARVSVGPWGYRLALTAYQDAAAQLLGGGALPDSVREDAMP